MAQVYFRVAGLIALPLALVALVPSLYANYRVWRIADDAAKTAMENRTATCSFVRDLQERYDSTAAYIKAVEDREVPPVPGLDLTALKTTNNNRKATLDSFADLDCQGGS